VLENLQYRILRHLYPGGKWDTCTGENYQGRDKLEVLFGPRIWEAIKGKRVLDYGCGEGKECISMLQHGAKYVVGFDIVPQMLELGREHARQAGVEDRVEFTDTENGQFDIIISIDAFEHYADPAAILKKFDSLLAPQGCICVSFGPPWKHPLGGHLFSVFPWAHLIMSEKALLRWRADFKADGATSFTEVRGGLNKMTIARFEKIVEESKFQFQWFEAVPIKRRRWMPFFHNQWTREWLTSIVRCQLVRKEMATYLHPNANHPQISR
jgi:SAM-dependent methyltransferase